MELSSKNICQIDNNEKTVLQQSDIALNSTKVSIESNKQSVMRKRHKLSQHLYPEALRLSTKYAISIIDKMLTKYLRKTNNYSCVVNQTKAHVINNSNNQTGNNNIRNEQCGNVASKSKIRKNLQILFVIIISMAFIDLANGK